MKKRLKTSFLVLALVAFGLILVYNTGLFLVKITSGQRQIPDLFYYFVGFSFYVAIALIVWLLRVWIKWVQTGKNTIFDFISKNEK